MVFSLYLVVAISCLSPGNTVSTTMVDTLTAIGPVVISDTVSNDSDDPAIWINKSNPAESLVIGTDKGGDDGDGGLHVFSLQGKEIMEKRVSGLKRPNNVDVAYGFVLSGQPVDIAVCTERGTNSIRVFTLPGMRPVDHGGIPVFEEESLRAPMGIALYTSPEKKIYAIVGRKNGVNGSYLWQYELKDDGRGNVTGTVVRAFGAYSGKKEIESIAVDNELGYVYYSDEGVGVRKYHAHPDRPDKELSLFATEGFTEDHEGISIYKTGKASGYIIVSDQGADKFHIFTREGSRISPHDHQLLRIVKVSAHQSDGSEVTSFPLPGFPEGLFVAMSDDKTFHFYDWGSMIGREQMVLDSGR